MNAIVPFRPGQPRFPKKIRKNHSSAARECRELAKIHGPDAIAQLYKIMQFAEDERAQVAAAAIILDRAYGKVVPMDEEGNPQDQVMKVYLAGTDTKL